MDVGVDTSIAFFIEASCIEVRELTVDAEAHAEISERATQLTTNMYK